MPGSRGDGGAGGLGCRGVLGKKQVVEVGAMGDIGHVGGPSVRKHILRGYYMPVPVLYSGDPVNDSSKALPSFYLGAEGKAENRGLAQR